MDKPISTRFTGLMHPLTLHHLEDSRSRRIVWLLEELSIPYTLVTYKRDRKTLLAPPELRKIHPLGKSPVITDPNRDNAVLAESGALIDDLVTTYGQGRLAPPLGSAQRLRYNYWLHYAEGSLMPPLLLRLVFMRVGSRPPWLVKPVINGIVRKVNAAFIEPQLTLHLDYLENELGKSATGWFVGDTFSAADVQMSFPLEMAVQRAGLDVRRPRLMGFLQRIHAMPAYQKALEVTGEVPWKLKGKQAAP